MDKLHGLDLFSGYGGITLALRDWVTPVAYCEIEAYAQAILLSRMLEGALPEAPIWDDVRTLRGDDLPAIDIVYGGFPCQDITCANSYGEGLDGERSGLFYQVTRLAEEVSAEWIFLENVPGIRTRGLDRVISELSDLRYDCRWTSISAAEVGAVHLRKRWFLLAKRSEAGETAKENGQIAADRADGLADYRKTKAIPNTDNGVSKRGIAKGDGADTKKGPRGADDLARLCPHAGGRRVSKPSVARTNNGSENRVDRARSIGNGVVPQQASKAFLKLIGVWDW